MLKSKQLICFVIGLLALIVSAEVYRAHRDAARQTWAARYLEAGVQESQNCLRKLAGGHASLKNTEAVLKPQLQECRLQQMIVAMPDVTQEACIGLALTPLPEKGGMRVRRMLLDHQKIDADKCARRNQIAFEFETTHSGLDWYDKMLTVMRNRQAEEAPVQPETVEPTLEQMADRNAFPDEIVSELQREKEERIEPPQQPAALTPKAAGSRSKHKKR